MNLVLGNINIRPNFLLKKGDKIEGHTHNFDHTTYIARGSVHIKGTKPDGTVAELTISCTDDYPFILVEKDVVHEITALVDDCVVHCVYAHRTPQGDVIQEYTGWDDAYQ